MMPRPGTDPGSPAYQANALPLGDRGGLAESDRIERSALASSYALAKRAGSRPQHSPRKMAEGGFVDRQRRSAASASNGARWPHRFTFQLGLAIGFGGAPTCRSPWLSPPSVFKTVPGAGPVDAPIWRMATAPTRQPEGCISFPTSARTPAGKPSFVLVPAVRFERTLPAV